MKSQIALSKFLSFFLTKIIIGVSCIVGVVALVEWAGRPLVDKTRLSDNPKNIIVAGFVAEILILGVIFRLIEEELGTIIALVILTLLFAVMHMNVKGANFLSVSSTAIQSGLLLSAAYVFSRSLWLPIFFHFAWDFAEPGVFGAINPGISIDQSLLTSKVDGPLILTGGQLGPQNSIQSLLLCSIVSLIFLWLAKQKNNFIKPSWKRKNIS